MRELFRLFQKTLIKLPVELSTDILEGSRPTFYLPASKKDLDDLIHPKFQENNIHQFVTSHTVYNAEVPPQDFYIEVQVNKVVTEKEFTIGIKENYDLKRVVKYSKGDTKVEVVSKDLESFLDIRANQIRAKLQQIKTNIGNLGL